MFELDEPSSSISREIDLEANPELASAIDPASEPEPSLSPLPEPEPAGDVPEPSSEQAAPKSSTAAPAVSVAPVQRAQTAEEQHEHRRRRTIVRVQTARDGFRLMGYLGIADDDRKAVARQLMDLDQAVGTGEGRPSLIKEPEQALAEATREQLDTLEKLLSPIEDKLLALDDTVAVETFRDRVESGKHSRKVIARYGRLLASRRFPAGQRRDRFEWIATHLLTSGAENGERVPLPPDKARPVLQQLVGGLPRKAKDGELQEALNYLEESRERLRSIQTHEDFFEGGFFLDVRGYNVSMRDQLTSPDYLYLCATVNAEMWNRLEQWVRQLEELHDANRLSHEGTPREQLMRRVREQESAVDKIFGVRRRAQAQTVRAEPKPAPVEKKAKAPKKTRAGPRLQVDPRLARFGGLLLLLAAIGIVLAFQTGQIGKERLEFLGPAQLEKLSPLLGSGIIQGEPPTRVLTAHFRPYVWRFLEPREKREVADSIAKELASQGIKKATITELGRPVIAIEGGLATAVEGGRL